MFRKILYYVRDKEKHTIKKSQIMQGNGSQLTALRFARNKHLGFPGHHSPCRAFHSGQYFPYKSNPLRWDAEHLSDGLQKTAQLLRVPVRDGLSLQL